MRRKFRIKFKIKNYITNFMDIGIIQDLKTKKEFDKQKNFSYFKFDDYWGLKETYKVVGFFDFSNIVLQSIE